MFGVSLGNVILRIIIVIATFFTYALALFGCSNFRQVVPTNTQHSPSATASITPIPLFTTQIPSMMLTTPQGLQTNIAARTAITSKHETRTAVVSLLSITPSPTVTLPPGSPTTFFSQFFDAFVSPDGSLAAVKISEYDHSSGNQALEVYNNSGELLYTITDPKELPWTDPSPHLSVFGWSKDSHLLYYYNAYSFDGPHTLWNGFALHSLDILTGKVKQVVDTDDLASFSISPSERFLAYILDDQDPMRITIRDLKSGVERTSIITFDGEEYTQGGYFQWAPDEMGLIFETIEGEYPSRAIYLDVLSMEQTVFLEFFIEDYWFHEWLTNNVATYMDSVGNILEIRILSDSILVLGTATPSP